MCIFFHSLNKMLIQWGFFYTFMLRYCYLLRGLVFLNASFQNCGCQGNYCQEQTIVMFYGIARCLGLNDHIYVRRVVWKVDPDVRLRRRVVKWRFVYFFRERNGEKVCRCWVAAATPDQFYMRIETAEGSSSSSSSTPGLLGNAPRNSSLRLIQLSNLGSDTDAPTVPFTPWVS